VGVEYVSRVPGPPLDGLIDDLYYLQGTPPYSRLMLPAAPAPLLIVNLGAPFLIRAGTDVETVEYADGCAVTTPTRAWEFSYPNPTRSVGVHFKPWGLAPFLPMPAAELCDRPATVEQIWGQPAIAELRDRLATADGPQEMLTLLEEELVRRLRVIDGLDLVRHMSAAVAATGGTVPISDISVAARASSTYLAKRFKAVVGVTPKRLARSYRFSSTVLGIDVAAPIDWGDVAANAATSTRPTSCASSGSSPSSRRPGMPKSVGGSLVRASRTRPGRLAAPRRLIPYKSDSSHRTTLGTPNRGGLHGESGHERVGFGGWFHRG
jgi:AraC-like DNA-binding protein